MGFCESELNDEVIHGVYNWTETEVGETDRIQCFYKNINAPNSTANVSRRCRSHREWADYDEGQCISVITFRFQELLDVNLSTF